MRQSHCISKAAAGHELFTRIVDGREREWALERWDLLDQDYGDGRLASSRTWVETWLNHYGSVVPHFYVYAEDDGRPCGIALVTKSTARHGPFRIKRVHLGTAGEALQHSAYVQYNTILCNPTRKRQFVREVIGILRNHCAWDELVLDSFAPDDAQVLLEVEPGFLPVEQSSPYFDFGRSSGTPLDDYKSKTRNRLRSNLRALGEISTEWADNTDHALDIFEELIALHQRRWNAVGGSGAFASATFTSFHRELIQQLVPLDRAVLFRVRNVTGTIACHYKLIDRDRLLSYVEGVNYPGHQGLRPGVAAHFFCMQAAQQRGFREYDFGEGDFEYKRELSNSVRALTWAKLRRGLLKWPLTAASHARHWWLLRRR